MQDAPAPNGLRVVQAPTGERVIQVSLKAVGLPAESDARLVATVNNYTRVADTVLTSTRRLTIYPNYDGLTAKRAERELQTLFESITALIQHRLDQATKKTELNVGIG
ncbi:MAG TPA: hypothetical protein VFH39_02175 [Candidatus Saccharimonadales bacterium]|nr:hypothetical protein [Candidatus Saccharimonadales bacterium]